MTFIETKIAPAILSAIRQRRGKISGSDDGTTSKVAAPLTPAKIREVRFSDFAAVADLKRRWNLAPDSYENWQRLWRDNPALATGPEHPMGWVLEAQGKIVGYLGNIIQLYRYANNVLRSATGHAFVVEPPYRASGLSLVAAYFRQKSVDLYISTGAIQPVGSIGRAFKSESLPQQDYKTVLFWVLGPYGFTKSIMAKLDLGRIFSLVGGAVASVLVAADKVISRRTPRQSIRTVVINEIDVGEIGDEFQDLWNSKMTESPTRLFAERDPSTLRWHFEIPGDKGCACVLCGYKDGRLHGYAVVRDEARDEVGLKKSIIADILVKNQDSETVKALLIAAHRHAERVGSHILELVGFPREIRKICFELHPYTRMYPTPIFGYKAVDTKLHETISHGETWYASPFDGDWSLIRASYASHASLPKASESKVAPEVVSC